MSELPWFIFTPSPVSLIQYAILSWYCSRQLLKTVEYKRFPRLLSLIEGFFAVAFFVVLGDALWAGFCALKWIPMFPQDAWQIIFSFWRDVVGYILFFLFMPIKAMRFSFRVKLGLLVMAASQAIWFLLAPSPVFTDYAFAWRHGASLEIIFGSYLLSHFIMRLPLWYVIYEVFRIEDSSIRLKKGEKHNSQKIGGLMK